ncbi:ABC transporter substrate-binding protein [Streptomyces peucetius]|uniref:ABC transporter substrate-binding protein n=1 Tax=Streptomyces peucetius TaxID=1950 RepID=A0ABY6I2F8_STRPE|nr:ABC transporter substrate-binding protein [Streptomyces peucetius]UYQ60187.1 ABC transporter substrate-binding protein [Streptomyces peucetius]
MSTMTHKAGRPGSPRTLRLASSVTATVMAAAMLTACGTGPGGASGEGLITLAMHNPNIQEQDPATYELVQAFNAKNPTMKVKLLGRPMEQHQQQMTIAAQSDTLPEVFWVYDALAKTMAKNGDLLDLKPVLAEKDLETKFAPNMLKAFEQGDTQYGVPYQALITGFYYNKAILDEHGIPVPKTFDDLLAAVKKLKAAGVVPMAQGANNSSFSVWAFLTMLDRFGYEEKYQAILDKKQSYDNADFLRLYKHVEELADAGAFPPNMSTQTYTQAVASFTAGQAAFLDSGVWEAAKIQQSLVGKDVGFWAGPTFSDGVGNQNLVMNAPSAPLVASAAVKKDPEKYEAVKKFLQFYYSDEGQQILVDNAQPPVTTYVPAVDRSKSPVFWAVLEEAARPELSSPAAQPDLVVPAKTANAMYDSFYGVMSGAMKPGEAVQLVQRTLK